MGAEKVRESIRGRIRERGREIKRGRIREYVGTRVKKDYKVDYNSDQEKAKKENINEKT